MKRWFGGCASVETVSPVALGSVDQQAAIDLSLIAYRAGVEQFQAGELALAEDSLVQALSYRHDLAEAHFYLGLIHRKRVQFEDAGDALVLATTFKPDFAEAWFYLGIVDLDRGRYDDARKSLESALRIRPNYAEAYHGLGSLCEQQRDFHAAAAYYRRAIQIDSNFALAYCNLAYLTLREFADADEALELAQKAVVLNPRLAAAHINLAMILQDQARCREAIIAAERALKLEPDAVRPKMSRALARLMMGDFEHGWRDYEARKYLLPTFKVRKFPYRDWDGSPLAGCNVLVYNEQGIGDEIMFASCLPDLLRLGGQCVVECSSKLEPLFRRSFPAAAILVADQDVADMSYLKALPPFAWQIAAGTLPLHFRTRLEDFPRHNGYMAADRLRTEYWRGRLRALGPGKKIGISWRGGSLYSNRSRRSVDLEQLLPLFNIPGAQFISLQYSECRGEIERLGERHGVTLHHWQEAIDDYDETAALMSALDLIISVQTAALHLAGALGRPTWVLVSSAPEWRYMAQGERMPWYPAVKIFRQPRNATWEPVVVTLRAELTAGLSSLPETRIIRGAGG